SYWHFINMARQGDAHGNDHGGYDYRYRKVDGSWSGDVDWYAMVYLYNRELKKSDFDTTEAHYRQGTSSNWQTHYGDFQTAAFQPIDNLAKYWFDQFKNAPSLQTIGYSLHTTGDVAQPHHAWVTSGNGHSGWEGWVDDHYFSEGLNNIAAVANRVGSYDPQKPIRDLLTQTAQVAYQRPEPLYDSSYATRLQVAKELIPESIALTVSVLTKGANTFYGQGGL
ncbi:MAG: phospholipase, partial [Gammaproteobacteria bacterium]|nr:phospholipase [Gammaproteobacteria bacterium]